MYYRYRGAPKPDPGVLQAKKIRELLRKDRQRLSFNASKSELAELEESKADLEERRLKLLAAARRLGVMDDYELVALSGLQRETIRKMTWGVRPESVV